MSREDARIAELVTACIERREREGDAAVEAVCAEHPEHAGTVRRRLRQLDDLGLLGEPDGAPALGALPERIAGHRLLRRLGQGGMGVVYLARQERLGRDVALKLVRPEHLWFPGARERFAREAEVVAALSHPGIVPVYEVGDAEGLPWLSMELVQGATLEQVLAAVSGRDPSGLTGRDLRAAVLAAARELGVGSSSVETCPSMALFEADWSRAAFRIARDVAEALAHAHDQGVLHRDIKPSNVAIGVDGRVRLLDFGLAARRGSSRLTVTGQLLGSLAYMPPERLRGDGTPPDARSDVYSLGATLFELLTLRTPFVGGSAEALRRQIVEGRAPSPRTLNRELDREAEAVCQVALDPEPERRYADASALAADLQRLLDREPVLARPPSSMRRVLGWSRRRPAAAGAAALALLLVVGGPAGYALLASRHADALSDLLEESRARHAEAEAQHARAEANLDLAREAVDTLLVEVSDETLDGTAGMEELRRDLRKAALAFYEPILEQRPTEPELVLRRLDVLRGVGSTQGQLGRMAASTASFAELTREAERLLADGPPDGGRWTPEQRDRLRSLLFAGQYGQVDVNQLMAGDGQAVAQARKALATARMRAEEAPADHEARYDVANVLGTLAGVLAGVVPDAEVDAMFTELLEMLAALEASALDEVVVLTRRMEVLYGLARHLSLLGEPVPERHEELLRAASALQRDLARRYAETAVPPSVREARALLLSALADTFDRLGGPAEAESLRRASIADSEAVVAASPALYLPLVILASTTHELAVQIHRAGRHDEARHMLRELVPRLHAARERWPEIEQVRRATAIVSGRLGWMLGPDGALDELHAVLAPLAEMVEARPDEHPAMGHPVIAAALARWEQRERTEGDAARAQRAAELVAMLADTASSP